MSFFKEFRDFAMKGNVIELAIAVVIGAAFGDIVNSLVEHILTPLILAPATKAAGVADIDKLAWGAVKYGKFLAAIIKFILIAFSLFIVVKALNKVNKRNEATQFEAALRVRMAQRAALNNVNKRDEATPSSNEPSSTDKLLMEIRDQLSAKNK